MKKMLVPVLVGLTMSYVSPVLAGDRVESMDASNQVDLKNRINELEQKNADLESDKADNEGMISSLRAELNEGTDVVNVSATWRERLTNPKTIACCGAACATALAFKYYLSRG